MINPTIDGSSGAPTVFNSGDEDLGPAPIESMTLTSHEVLDGGAVWLRYKLTSAAGMTLLAGFKVVQIGGGSAAAVCGRLLADVGAQVTCIDPDAGTTLLAYLNHGKPVAADGSGTSASAGSRSSDRARRTAEGLAASPYDLAGAAADQSVGDRRHDLALRRDRTAGERSGHRPHAVLRQRHRAPADRPGGRSVGSADPAGRRAIGLHRRPGRRLCRHACGAGQPARRVDRRLDPGSAGDAGHDRARARGAERQELGAQAPDRRQRRNRHDPAGERRLRRDLAARGEAVGGVAAARWDRRPGAAIRASRPRPTG